MGRLQGGYPAPESPAGLAEPFATTALEVTPPSAQACYPHALQTWFPSASLETTPCNLHLRVCFQGTQPKAEGEQAFIRTNISFTHKAFHVSVFQMLFHLILSTTQLIHLYMNKVRSRKVLCLIQGPVDSNNLI